MSNNYLRSNEEKAHRRNLKVGPRGNMKAFIEFRKTLEKEIENALLQKMRSFRDEILRSRLK